MNELAAEHPVSEVTAQVSVENDAENNANFTIVEEIEDAAGNVVARSVTENASVPAASTSDFRAKIAVPDAHLWSLDDPCLYKLVTKIQNHGSEVDRYETTFGIRTIRFDPDHGFFLNGKRVELKGTNDHQDHAGVGVAVPDTLNAFRVERLKAMGSKPFVHPIILPPSNCWMHATSSACWCWMRTE